jgi:hypothetical protein
MSDIKHAQIRYHISKSSFHLIHNPQNEKCTFRFGFVHFSFCRLYITQNYGLKDKDFFSIELPDIFHSTSKKGLTI